MKAIINYIKGARVELTKVSWPSRRQATRLTIIVVVFSIVWAVVVGGLDFGFSEILQRFFLKGLA